MGWVPFFHVLRSTIILDWTSQGLQTSRYPLGPGFHSVNVDAIARGCAANVGPAWAGLMPVLWLSRKSPLPPNPAEALLWGP